MKKNILILLSIFVLFNGCRTIDMEQNVKNGDVELKEGTVQVVEKTDDVIPSIEVEEVDEVEFVEEDIEVSDESAIAQNQLYALDIEPIIVPQTRYIVVDKEESKHLNLEGRDAVKQSLKDSIVSLKDYVGGVSIFDYDENYQFPIFTKVLKLTTIMLNEDEKMSPESPPFLSDTERWDVIGDVWQTEDGKERQLIVLKPKFSGLETSMVVMTNKRLYQFILYSTNNDYQPMVKFRYPKEREFITSKTKVAVPTPLQQVIDEVDWDKVSVNYKIVVSANSKKVDWIPQFVYDDGSKTYIIFPEVILQKEMPGVWEGKNEITNYIVDPKVHNMMIINKLVDKVTLKLGNKKIKIIKKKGESADVELMR